VVVVGYIVNSYCFRLYGGVACDVVVGFPTVTVNNITNYKNTHHSSVEPQTVRVNNITNHNNTPLLC
jgi:hypothetical protein